MATKTAKRRAIIEEIEDFSGGLNSAFSANMVKDEESPTSDNCWIDTGTLKKRNGSTRTQVAIDSNNMTGSRGMFRYINGSTEGFYFMASDSTSSYIFQSNDGTSFTPVQYTVGTVTTTSGSSIVTGSGTLWSANIIVGDYFKLQGQTQVVRVSSVDSDTQITLVSNWTTGAASQNYRILLTLVNPEFESMNNAVWATNHQSPTRTGAKITGTTYAPVTSMPANALYIRAYKNYMFVGNTSAGSSRISWSALKDPTTWPASNFIDVNPDDGFSITGLVNDGQSLLVLKEHRAYKVTGDIFDPANPTYTVQEVHVPDDCILSASRTWALFNGAFIFFGFRGLYIYRGGMLIERLEVSNKIQPDWDTVVPYTWNGSTLYASAVAWKGRYWLDFNISPVGTGGYKGYTIERNGTFWRWGRADGTNTVIDKGILKSNLIGTTAGFVYILDTGFSDNGSTAINGTWTSKVFEFDGTQHFGRLWVAFKKQSAGNLTLEYSVDEGSFTSITVDMTSGTGTRVKSPEFLIGQEGVSIQFRVSNNVAAQDFEVYGIYFERYPLRS